MTAVMIAMLPRSSSIQPVRRTSCPASLVIGVLDAGIDPHE